MYTILMNDDKSLTTSVKTTLYQREKLVDKVQFLFPERYGDLALSNCNIILKYVDQGNVAHSETLVKDKELYKGKIRCVLPVDTNLTAFAGDVTVRVTLSYLDMNTKTHYVLHTGEATLTISPLSDYYTFCGDDSLEIIDQKMAELDAKIKATEAIAEIYDATKADNISKDGNEVQLLSNGIPIGDIIVFSESEGSDDDDDDGSDADGEFKVVEF